MLRGENLCTSRRTSEKGEREERRGYRSAGKIWRIPYFPGEALIRGQELWVLRSHDMKSDDDSE